MALDAALLAFLSAQEQRLRLSHSTPVQIFHGRPSTRSVVCDEYVPAPPHGAFARYQHGCRCRQCRQANTDRVRRERLRAREYAERAAMRSGLRAYQLSLG